LDGWAARPAGWVYCLPWPMSSLPAVSIAPP
jgi:hypothetical protein